LFALNSSLIYLIVPREKFNIHVHGHYRDYLDIKQKSLS